MSGHVALKMEGDSFSEIWGLFMLKGGYVAGFWYHVNREAVELKAREVLSAMPDWEAKIVRYVRAES